MAAGGGTMNLISFMGEAIKAAKQSGKIFYVCGDNGNYRITSSYQDVWLFRVWPGGRKELSIKGNELVKKEAGL